MRGSAADIDILRAEINFSYARMVDTLVGARASEDLPLFHSNAIPMFSKNSAQGKAIPLQAWAGLEGSRSLRLADFKTIGDEGGKFVSPTHRPPFPPRKHSWYSFLLEDESTPRAIVRPEVLCQ